MTNFGRLCSPVSAMLNPPVCLVPDLTLKLSDQLEMIQKHAVRISNGGLSFTNRSYECLCDKLDFFSLSARRDELAERFSTYFSTQSAACIVLFPEKG